MYKYSLLVSLGLLWAAPALPATPAAPAPRVVDAPPDAAAVRQATWDTALVFRRQVGGRLYLATLRNPSLPKQQIQAAPGSTAATAQPAPSDSAIDYEIWLLRGERTAGLWYSSTEKQYGTLSFRGALGPGNPDDGSLGRLAEKPPLPTSEPPRSSEALEGTGLSPASESLSNLVQIGLALRMYAQEYAGSLPPLTSAETLQRRLSGYVTAGASFRQPVTRGAYRTNPRLGRRLGNDNRGRVAIYEATPIGGTRGVVLADGTARRVGEAEWARLRRASRIP